MQGIKAVQYVIQQHQCSKTFVLRHVQHNGIRHCFCGIWRLPPMHV